MKMKRKLLFIRKYFSQLLYYIFLHHIAFYFLFSTFLDLFFWNICAVDLSAVPWYTWCTSLNNLHLYKNKIGCQFALTRLSSLIKFGDKLFISLTVQSWLSSNILNMDWGQFPHIEVQKLSWQWLLCSGYLLTPLMVTISFISMHPIYLKNFCILFVLEVSNLSCSIGTQQCISYQLLCCKSSRQVACMLLHWTDLSNIWLHPSLWVFLLHFLPFLFISFIWCPWYSIAFL